jgi:aspartate aminotransferase
MVLPMTTLLSQRVNLIQESPTLAVVARATALKQRGQDVLILAAGEPDFPTPQHIKDAAIAAINNNKTKYTAVAGIVELRQAVCRKLQSENSLDYIPNQILVSCGAKHSIYNALQALLNPGDEVVIPAPYWVSYPDMVLLSGGIPICVPCDISQSFKLTPKQLNEAITPRTRAVIINSPSNPTGMVYTEDELTALADVLRNHPQVIIISDDIYEHILFGDGQFLNLANVAPDLLTRIIVVNGVSKAYSMTGWRIGYAACSDTVIIEAMTKIQSQSTSNPTTISQYAALAALNGGLQSVEEMRLAFISRHEYVIGELNKIDGVKCLPAQGAFYAFFDCSAIITALYNKGKLSRADDLALANYLLDEHLVALVPGSAFGLENFMRLSFATNMEELEKAFLRLSVAFAL